MKRKLLGQTQIEVSPLMLGTNVFGWNVDEAGTFKILDQCVAEGLNFIDTADVYSRWIPGNQGGESETLIGRWFKARGSRQRVVLATKVGMDLGDGKQGLSKKYIRQAVEASLKRLQTDHIDLYQAHRDDTDAPLTETLEAFTELRKEGKVRAIGASNYEAPRLREALEVSEKNGLDAYQTLQPLYNLYDRAVYEKDLEPLCIEKRLGVINYFSLASGFLTGKYRSAADLKDKARGERVKGYLNDRGLRIVHTLVEIAEAKKVTPAQVALAWLMHRPSITAPIASATSVDQLKDLIRAADVELDREALTRLKEASDEK